MRCYYIEVGPNYCTEWEMYRAWTRKRFNIY